VATRSFLKTLGILVLLACGAWLFNRVTDPAEPPLFSSGDPGGKIMAQILPAGKVHPPASHVFKLKVGEPTWTVPSCGGAGWTGVYTNLVFDSPTMNVGQVVQFLNRRLKALGWTYTSDHPWGDWQRKLRGGGTAYAEFDIPANWKVPANYPDSFPIHRPATGRWSLTTSANPVTPVLSGRFMPFVPAT
jgi:hypothetical protein